MEGSLVPSEHCLPSDFHMGITNYPIRASGIQYCYPLLVSTAAGLCGGDVDYLRSSLVSPVYGGTGTENCVTRDIWSLANYWLISVTN